MTPAQTATAAAGLAMFGPQWQTPLAAILEISPRHLRHMMHPKAPRPFPADWGARITQALVAREALLSGLRRTLHREKMFKPA